MPKQLKEVEIRDFSGGTLRTVQPSLCPANTYKLGLNLDSDKTIGALDVRLGTDIIGQQMLDNKPCLGLHQHFEASGTKVFGVYSDGVNNDIYLASSGAKSLEDDTKDLRTRFLTYLGSTVRVNGADACKSYTNAGGWIAANSATCTFDNVGDTIDDVAHGLSNGDIVKFSTTGTLPAELSINTVYYVVNKNDDDFQIALTAGGTAIDFTDDGTGTHTWEYWDTYDLTNMPICSVVREWKDRVYAIGGAIGSGILKYSSIADPSTKTISWTQAGGAGAGQIEIEQEDSGGELTAIAKVPGYLLLFKERTMKRWSGASTFPDDLIKQGVYSQECVCEGKEMVFMINTKGVWATNGGYPVRISKPVQDFIDNIPGANWDDASCWTDDEYAFFSIGNITINEEVHTNVVLKYNMALENWDIRSYGHEIAMFNQYIDTNNLPHIMLGDTDGNILQLDIGTTDYDASEVKDITWSLETQDLELGSRFYKKSLARIGILTHGVVAGSFLIRLNSRRPEDWDSLGPIDSPITDIEDKIEQANWYNFKMTGVSNSGDVQLLGWVLPDESILIYDNTEK